MSSYDSGYEHSPEHWLEVQQLVEAVEMERSEDTGLQAASDSSFVTFPTRE